MEQELHSKEKKKMYCKERNKKGTGVKDIIYTTSNKILRKHLVLEIRRHQGLEDSGPNSARYLSQCLSLPLFNRTLKNTLNSKHIPLKTAE